MGPVLTMPTRDYGSMKRMKESGARICGRRIEFPAFDDILAAARRMAREAAFEVCEMPVVTYLCARDAGRKLTALPVFLTRNFHHGAIHVDARGGVRAPKDLEGRTVAVTRGYTVTTGVWARAVLRTEHGVDLDRVRWAATGDEHIAEFAPPPNVDYRFRSRSAAELIASGEAAAAVGALGAAPAGIAPLIPDAEAAGFESWRRTGVYPVNHLVALTEEVVSELPGLPAALFEALVDSKTAWLSALDRSAPLSGEDALAVKLERGIGGDPFPYGIAPNREALEALREAVRDQRIVRDPPPVEALFAPSTHGLTG